MRPRRTLEHENEPGRPFFGGMTKTVCCSPVRHARVGGHPGLWLEALAIKKPIPESSGPVVNTHRTSLVPSPSALLSGLALQPSGALRVQTFAL